MVNTEYQKCPSPPNVFFPWRAKKALTENQSPAQKLEVGPHSQLVILTAVLFQVKFHEDWGSGEIGQPAVCSQDDWQHH